MVITIVADVLGKANNGTTITIMRLIDNLKERGYEVRVVSPTPVAEEGFYCLPKRNFFVFNEYMEKNGVELAKPDREILEKAIVGADVVHIALPFRVGREARKIAEEHGIPVTSAFHCQPENITSHLGRGVMNMKFLNDGIYHRFYRKFYKNVRYVHCPSEMIRRMLVEHGYNMDLRVISNGVEDAFFDGNAVTPDQNKINILFTGRLVREKRQDLLIDAVAESRYEDKIQLYFAGTGPLQKKLEKQAEKLTNSPVFGFYRQEELISLMKRMTLYVHPSDVEIEAISCLEAISCGLVPVISDSTRSATNAFALSEHNLFRAGDPKSLAEKIDFLIENPSVTENLKEQYHGYAENFRISRCIDRMEEMFRDAASRNGERAV